MSSYSRMINNAGYSLVELLMGLGITMFLLISLVAILQTFTAKTSEFNLQAQYRLDLSVLDRALFSDLSTSANSLGNLLEKQNGQSQPFFEYFGDISIQKFPEEFRTRQFALDVRGGVK